MYSFYETIKNEVDLQDLVDYLNNPLEKLKLLQIKLQEYKAQHNSENKIEIEELIRETDKLEKSLFPDLINNYCKLSLEFRNNTVIKEGKDKQGKTINYTSKDLLLKNIAKLIEHINLLDEKFYKYFSFEFLVNSRIISDLGYQENYIDKNYEPVVLKNQYVFSKDDAKKIIDKQLGKNIEDSKNERIAHNNVQNVEDKKPEVVEQDQKKLLVEATLDFIEQPEIQNKPKPNTAVLLQPKVEDVDNTDIIFEKKNQPVVEQTLPEDNKEASSGGSFSLIELILALGMVSMLGIGVSAAYNKTTEGATEYEQKIQQERLINQIKEQNKDEAKQEVKTTQDVLKELSENRDKNKFMYEVSDDTYKKAAILMNQMIDWRKLSEKYPDNDKISFNALNGFQVDRGQVLASPRDMIDNGKAFRIDIIDNKAQLKISNISANECKYNTFKLSGQYDMQANDKTVNVENMNSVCEVENKLTIRER